MALRIVVITVVWACSVLAAASASAQDVQLRFNDGYVTLKATNATVSRILQQWARIGETTVVNGDRVQGLPVTLELIGVTERQALDILLRDVSGYMVAQGASRGVATSRFDRILILPTSAAPRATIAGARPAPAGRGARVSADDRDDQPSPDADQTRAESASADASAATAEFVPEPPRVPGSITGPMPAFGTWRDPGDDLRRSAAATLGAATASRPGEATAVVPPPRPADAWPTPNVANQTFQTHGSADEGAGYQMMIQRLQEEMRLKNQQQPAAATGQ